MATLENIREESDGEIDEFTKAEREFSKIPAGLPGSSKSSNVRNSKPEQIGVGTNQSVKRKPGRPPGAGNRKYSTTTGITSAQNFWTTATALGLNLGTAVLAAKLLHDKKYIMTEVEAKSAANALILVGFKYKSIRDLAVIVNADSDTALIIKGFWPYIHRAFLKEIIEDVITGLFISKPRKSGKSGTEQRFNTGPVSPIQSNGNSESNGAIGREQPEPTVPEIFSVTDWRAD